MPALFWGLVRILQPALQSFGRTTPMQENRRNTIPTKHRPPRAHRT
jgi:hypothetical protein